VIISASRRTDIPALYSQWFMNRIREGYCTVVNPYNRKQVSRISLEPKDIDIIVFVTKNPRPLLPYLAELDSMGYRYYFHFTLNGYPRAFEPYVPELKKSIQTFQELASTIGAEKVIWRYDPIIISNITGYEYHKARFNEIAQSLQGSTHRVIISIVDSYRKAVPQYKQLAKQDVYIQEELSSIYLEDLIRNLVQISIRNNLDIYSCSEKLDLRSYGVSPGKCIDDEYIQKIFGISVKKKKDKTQRLECGCIESRDIGIYNTCLHGCAYCYAGTYEGGRRNIQNHCPDSPSLLGYIDVENTYTKQLSLFEES
jgi:DNA repair photolyase